MKAWESLPERCARGPISRGTHSARSFPDATPVWAREHHVQHASANQAVEQRKHREPISPASRSMSRNARSRGVARMDIESHGSPGRDLPLDGFERASQPRLHVLGQRPDAAVASESERGDGIHRRNHTAPGSAVRVYDHVAREQEPDVTLGGESLVRQWRIARAEDDVRPKLDDDARAVTPFTQRD